MLPERRSTRKRKTPQFLADGHSSDLEFQDEVIETYDDVDEWRPPPKKRKTTVRKSSDGKTLRGNRGKLAEMLDLPLDLLFAILATVHPGDLVNVARTTKTLRKFLLDRSALWVWKQAQSNISGLPECPEDLKEVEYASLAFDNECQVCGRRNCKVETCWRFRRNLCRWCLLESGERYIDEWNLPALYLESVVLKYCPRECISLGRKSKTFYDQEYLHINHSLYESLDSEQKLIWEREEKVKYEKTQKHAIKYRAWFTTYIHDQRRQQLNDMRSARENEIIKRLKDMGWGDVVDNLPGLRSHGLVKQPKILTEKIWKNIQPSLVRYLELHKSECIDRMHMKRISACIPVLHKFHKKYVRSKPINAVIPTPSGLLRFEPIRNLIFNTRNSEALTIENIEEVANGDMFCTSWRKKMDHQLLRMSINGPVTQFDLDSAEEILSRAVVAFKCDFCPSSCNSYISYPRVLMHHDSKYPIAFEGCFKYSLEFGPPSSLHALYELNEILHDYYADRTRRILFDPGYRAAAEIVIKACGLDPKTASNDDMDNLDPFFECTHKSNAERIHMDWKAAVLHLIEHGNNNVNFTRITNEPVLQNLRTKRGSEELVMDREAKKDRYICKCCRFSTNTKKGVEDHIKLEHPEGIIPPNVVRHIDEPRDCFKCWVPQCDRRSRWHAG